MVIEKTRREQEEDWTGTQLHAAGRLPISSAHSMNARKCVHAQKAYPSQAFAHESSEIEGRGKYTGKIKARRLMERKAAEQNKNTSEELKQGLSRHRLRLAK